MKRYSKISLFYSGVARKKESSNNNVYNFCPYKSLLNSRKANENLSASSCQKHYVKNNIKQLIDDGSVDDVYESN